MEKNKIDPIFVLQKDHLFGKIYCGDAIEFLENQPENSCKLIIGSPPYFGKLDRYKGVDTGMSDWVEYMTRLTQRAVLVSSGYVIWIINGPVLNSCYNPVCERLSTACFDAGIALDRPWIWYKNAANAPSGRARNCWELIQVYRHKDKNVTLNLKSIGHPPKYKSGGKYKQRGNKGQVIVGGNYPQNKICIPEDVLKTEENIIDELYNILTDEQKEEFYKGQIMRIPVGGGMMGSKLSSENEAAYPQNLIEPLIKVYTDIDDTVCDPFSGSGTSGAAAFNLGRNFIANDLRMDQCELTNRRIKQQYNL